MNLYNSSYNLNARGLSVSPGQVAIIAYLRVIRCERFFVYMTALLNFCQSSRVKSAMGTLAESIDSTLCAKFFPRRTMRRNRYRDETDIYTMNYCTSNEHNMLSIIS